MFLIREGERDDVNSTGGIAVFRKYDLFADASHCFRTGSRGSRKWSFQTEKTICQHCR